MEPREFALSRNSLVICMFPNGTKLVPNATLSGMECQYSSGAQHRCGSATDIGADHAFDPATAAVVGTAGCGTVVGFFGDASVVWATGPLRMRRVDVACFA